jgi:hypothetical protein
MTELIELETDYKAGKYRSVEQELETFVRKHKRSILECQKSFSKRKPISLEQAIKLYILQIRSLNPSYEIRAQLEEIEREIWYRGEWSRHEVDRNEIAREWCRRHAPGWRDHNVLAVIFVFDKNKDRYLRIFNDHSPATRA